MFHHKMAIRGQGAEPHRPSKALNGPTLLFIACTALLGCAGSNGHRRDGGATAADIDSQADALFQALRDTAIDHQLTLVRDDPDLRRLTSEWIDESADIRRRYHLAVICQPRALAIRIHIVRQVRVLDEVPERWEDTEPTSETVEEENRMLVEAYQSWQRGADDDHP